MLFPHMTVEQNISYAQPLNGGIAHALARRSAMGIVGLEELLERYPAELFGRPAAGWALPVLWPTAASCSWTSHSEPWTITCRLQAELRRIYGDGHRGVRDARF